MKKTTALRITAMLLLATLAVFALTSCGKTLSGTYATDPILNSYSSITFSGSKMTVKAYVLGALATTFEGTYKINGDTIVASFEQADASAYNGSLSFSQSDDAVVIAGITYKKQK